jgi:hypothetical protein
MILPMRQEPTMARQVGTAPKISAKSPTPTKSPKPKTDQPGRPVMNDPTMRAMSKAVKGKMGDQRGANS